MNLNDIRNNIDTIDDEILTLLIKRAELSNMVKKLKQKEGKAVFNPARQVNILRKLINNPQDLILKETIIRIWSEIMGASIKMQNPDFKVCVFMPTRGAGFIEITRDTFGFDVNINIHSSIGQVIKDVADNNADIGIVPLKAIHSSSNENNRWWYSLINSKTSPKINMRLPLIGCKEARGNGEEAFALCSYDKEDTPSGNDKTLLVAEIEGFSGSDIIKELLNQANLKVENILDSFVLEKSKAYFIEIDDFILEDSEKFKEIISIAQNKNINFFIIGHYPEILL